MTDVSRCQILGVHEKVKNIQENFPPFIHSITTFSLGEVRSSSINLREEELTFIQTDQKVIEVHTGELDYRIVMKGWLTHLLCCQHLSTPMETIVVSRNPSKIKNDEYLITIGWKALSNTKAIEYLTRLRELASNGEKECWPIPPKSGWEMASNKRKSSKNSEKAFNRTWIGNQIMPGERSRPEMKICFGDNLNSEELLRDKTFNPAFESLYNHLIENIITK